MRDNSDNARKIFHKLASIEESYSILLANTEHGTRSESIALSNARGRTMAIDAFSSVDLPPFDRAEMDGYAVSSEDIEGASDQRPVSLEVVGSISAGDGSPAEVRRGTCAEIATGAPLPRGADSVVMVEYTSRRGDTVTFFRGVAPSENVASSGSDVQIGEMVLRQGTAIGPREVAILSAIGLASVQVFRRPRVGIISTGDELVPPGASLPFGKIYDVNSTSLIAAVEEAGGEGIYYGHADDDYVGIKSAIEDAVKEFDLVLISGGTSAGTGDLAYRVLEDVCTPGILVHGLRVKPGKPTIIASHNGKAVIGLPGYPVSALMIFDQLVKPFIELVAGNSARPAHLQRGRLAQRVNGAKGRRWLLPVHVINSRESPVVYPIIASSGATSALAKADGYVVISEDDEYVDAGEEVMVRLFPGERRPDLVIMGSHCPGLDILLQLLYRQDGMQAKTANIGSQGGFAAVSRGEADIAGAHLLDPKTMSYNAPYLAQYGLGGGCILKGYRRLQGIMVPRGNPRGILCLGDIIGKDIIFVNRNRGSGTRMLIDMELSKAAVARGIDFGSIAKYVRGYRWEAKTHSAVGAAISQGRADAGVGVKSVAVSYGLDFIPMSDEEYDFIVNPSSAEKPAVVAFKDCLRSEAFRRAITALPGYSPWGEGAP